MAYLNAVGVVIQIVMTLKSILIKIKIAFETLHSGMHTQVHENKHKSQVNVLHAWSCHSISSTSPSSSLVSTTEACRLPSPTYTNEQWHQHTTSATLRTNPCWAKRAHAFGTLHHAWLEAASLVSGEEGKSFGALAHLGAMVWSVFLLKSEVIHLNMMHTHTHLKNSVPCHDTSTVPHRNLHETLWPTKAQSQVACNNRLQQICYQQRIAKEPSNEKVNVCFYAFDRKELWWGSFWDLASSMAQCDAFTSSTKERCSFAKLRKDLCIHRLPLLPLIFLRSFWLVDCYIVMVLSLQTWLRCWHGSWSRKRRDQSNKTLTQI